MVPRLRHPSVPRRLLPRDRRAQRARRGQPAGQRLAHLHGVLLAPVTLAFGAPVTFAVLVAGNLAATGDRLVPAVRPDPAACTGPARWSAARSPRFAPGMVSQSNAHLHMTAAVAGAADRLVRDPARPGQTRGAWRDRPDRAAARRPGRAAVLRRRGGAVPHRGHPGAVRARVRGGRPAGRRGWRRRSSLGLGLAAGLAAALLAYPLWLQFPGPQSAERRRLPAVVLLRRPGQLHRHLAAVAGRRRRRRAAGQRARRVHHVLRRAAAARRARRRPCGCGGARPSSRRRSPRSCCALLALGPDRRHGRRADRAAGPVLAAVRAAGDRVGAADAVRPGRDPAARP